METFLFKFSACLLVFWLVYILILERQKMHFFKRFYLLFSVSAALIIPTLTITHYVEPVITDFEILSNYIPVESSFIEAPIVEPPFWNLETVLWLIYGIGVLILSMRFIVNLLGMYHRIRSNEKVQKRTFTYVLLKQNLIPHTFFKYIFFNRLKFKENTIPNEVVLHEETHAKQLHSIDILITELLQIVFWFHPLIYILKHHIKLNHEFLADQAVLQQGADTKVYQNILLQFSSSTSDYALSSAINYSSIKKRFTVMKTQTSKTRIWLSSLVVLPLIAILFYSFSSKEYVEKGPIEILQNQKELQLKRVTDNLVTSTQNSNTIRVHFGHGNQIQINDEPGSLKSLEAFLEKLPKTETYNLEIVTDKGVSLVVLFKAMSLLKKYKVLYSPNEIEWDEVEHFLAGAIIVEFRDYNEKYKLYESLRNKAPHYIYKSKDEQNQMNDLFSDLGGLYFRMSSENKQKVKRPTSPVKPYTKITLKGKTYYKKYAELTAEERATLTPPLEQNKSKDKGGPNANDFQNYYPIPPPIPENATPAERKKMQHAIDEFEKKYKRKVHTATNMQTGELISLIADDDVYEPNQDKKKITVLINRKNDFLINDERGSFESLEKHLKELPSSGYTVTFKTDKETSPKLKTKVLKLFEKYNIVKDSQEIEENVIKETLQQKTATSKQVAEYNAWANKMNLSDNKIIMKNDLKKFKHIYNIMSDEQKKTSEAFPQIPPPPPPANVPLYKNGMKKTLNEIIEETPKGAESGYEMLENGGTHYFTIYNGKKTYYNSNGYFTDNQGNVLPPPPPTPEAPKTKKSEGDIPPPPPPPPAPVKFNAEKQVPPPPPPPPKSAYEFVKSLKKDDITYYFEDKKVSYSDILKITKDNPNISMHSNIQNNKGFVKFWIEK